MRIPTNRIPTHPGEMLLEDFLVPLGMTQQDLAQRLHVSYPRINELIHGKRGVTPDTALRLAKLFGTSPEFWLNGQLAWDLFQAMHSAKMLDVAKIQPLEQMA
jgi:antitoxin HigA-1